MASLLLLSVKAAAISYLSTMKAILKKRLDIFLTTTLTMECHELSTQSLPQSLIDFVLSYSANNSLIKCDGCQESCGLVKVYPTYNLLLSIRCQCEPDERRPIVGEDVYEDLRKALKNLTPFNLVTAIFREFPKLDAEVNADSFMVPKVHMPFKKIRYLSIFK